MGILIIGLIFIAIIAAFIFGIVQSIMDKKSIHELGRMRMNILGENHSRSERKRIVVMAEDVYLKLSKSFIKMNVQQGEKLLKSIKDYA